MIRDTCALLTTMGASRSRSWVIRTIRAWQRSAVPVAFGDALFARLEVSAEQRAKAYAESELRYVLTYADNTGEAATAHVMAAQRRPDNRPH